MRSRGKVSRPLCQVLLFSPPLPRFSKRRLNFFQAFLLFFPIGKVGWGLGIQR